MTIPERLERADKALKEASEKLALRIKNQAAANCCDPVVPTPISRGEFEYLETRLGWLREDLGYLRQELYNHEEGHLPKVFGAAAMEKALKALGLGGDYKVEKRVIYANDGSVTAEQFLVSKASK